MLSTSVQQGYQFTPTTTGFLNSITLNLTSFEMTASGRMMMLTIYSGAGLGGTQLFQQTFQLGNSNNNSNVTLVLNNTTSPLLDANTIYTMAFQDVTSGGTSYR